jgi:hypothetical protein
MIGVAKKVPCMVVAYWRQRSLVRSVISADNVKNRFVRRLDCGEGRLSDGTLQDERTRVVRDSTHHIETTGGARDGYVSRAIEQRMPLNEFDKWR